MKEFKKIILNVCRFYQYLILSVFVYVTTLLQVNGSGFPSENSLKYGVYIM